MEELDKTQGKLFELIIRVLIGTFTGLILSVIFNVLNNEILQLDLSRIMLIRISIGFSVYCGILSAILGKNFWKFLEGFINGM